MLSNEFSARFLPTAVKDDRAGVGYLPLRQFIREFGGKVFNRGLYRVYTVDEVRSRTDLICNFFKAIRGKALAFACDWLGRQFVLDFRKSGIEPTVSCMEPGAASSFCTDQNLADFHNIELVQYAADALAEPFFQSWISKNVDLKYNECVGYKVPLFLGGKDELDNLHRGDIDVYLDLCRQLYEKSKTIPEGSKISSVEIQ
jgi:hypothetical protein